MSRTIVSSEKMRTATGHPVTCITFAPCGHQRSVGGWNPSDRYAVGQKWTDCGQGPCMKQPS